MNDIQTRRINRGRGHSYEIDGRQVDGVTTIIGEAIRKRALENWIADQPIEYAEDHWDELVAMTISERRRAMERARYQKRDDAARRGTEVHELALRLAAGEEITPPEAIAGHVDAYLQFVADWQPVELLVEVPVFHRSYGYAGTLDLVAELADGWTWLLDWKTGGKGIYPETALQLAAYRHAEFYVDANGDEQPLPPIDCAGAVWLRADGYDLMPVDAGDESFLIFRYAQQIARKFIQAPADQFVQDTITPPGRAAS